MITEDYVSFEIAKLLKEKGFDVPVRHFYNQNGLCCRGASPYNWNDDKDIDDGCADYSCPSIYVAMKWLRTEHSLHCSIDYDFVLGWYCQITSLKETVEYDYEEMKHYHPEKDNGFSSPEEACEAAIRYCLEKLI